MLVDETRATITCNQEEAPGLQKALRDRGVHVSPLALKGRFHWTAHQSEAERLIEVVSRIPALQLVEAAETVLPIRTSSTGQYLQTGKLQDIALRAILTEQSRWHETVEMAYAGRVDVSDSRFICFGSERCLPPTVARKLGSRLLHVEDYDFTGSGPGAGASLSTGSDDRIAVIGMACHVPNAEDVESFWQMLLSGQSQHREVPSDRFTMDSVSRDVDPSRKWYGNFIRDHDAFDHKFFKKSPREMSSTDPQHRIALQLAYQTVQQAGYFAVPDFDKHIGVYMGHANTDYEHNIRCYPANAYSATGNLKSMLSGKISHYFGWTGPSMSLDTACSASSVAIHLACRAILNGEVNGALAGGVNILTSPEWYHNLAGASFLSPTGQCKSFDAKGDGYCRGEGAGMVFLKKLSSALADGDQVLGVIAATSVLQNQNCTPITVPNSTSLEDLFRGVIAKARLKPHDITVVEAHGTGTPVGDPAEYDGIRRVLGGLSRPNRLALTAVKGSIGHLEVASGIASLIKVLLMIHEGAVPPQASLQSVNPSLKATPEDNIDISTTLKPWNAPIRAALINNYGASGSNASLVVTEPPPPPAQIQSASIHSSKPFPFWISAFDDSSLKRMTATLRDYFQRHAAAKAHSLTLSNLSFQLARQSNRSLPQSLILSATSTEDLNRKLLAFGQGAGVQSSRQGEPRPVIMCFGGQISTYVGLDKDVFDNVAVFRVHLNRCDALCRSLGLPSIYPDIFQRTPLSDISKLQTILFAMQYSCAMTWIDCGVKVSAIIGHSFGELTGLSVSGALSLRDAIRLVAKRGQIIQTSWTADSGSMMAVEGDLAVVEMLLNKVNEGPGQGISIACYNGPKTFTLAGPAEAVHSAEQLAKTDNSFAGLRVKILKVTNAFHSGLVDPLREELLRLGHGVGFRDPVIPLEHATEQAEPNPRGEDFFSQHLRNPVYFHHAAKRLSERYPDAIWLEAGSNSTITNMASKALGSPATAHFQPVNITSDGSWSLLVETTTRLWQGGVNCSFWAHHKSQISDYSPVLLPPYQFEKARHWLDIKEAPVLKEKESIAAAVPEPEKGLTTFFGFLDETKRSVRFRVNTNTPEFIRIVQAHVLASTAAVMPGMYQVEVAIDALTTLREEFRDFSYQPELRGLSYYSPLVPQHCSAVWLEAQAADSSGLTWDWKLIGQDAKGTLSRHTAGTIAFYQPQDVDVQGHFARLSRLGAYKRCKRLLYGDEADDAVVGRNIYRAFEGVIDYKDVFRHLTKLVGKDGDSAGRVVRSHDSEGWLDSILSDCFCQVAGVAVNLFSNSGDFAESGIYIGDRVERWTRAPGLRTDAARPKEWEVFAMSKQESDGSFISDVFAFDARDGSLYETVLGIRYSRVPMLGIRKALGRIIAENPIGEGNRSMIPAASVASQMSLLAGASFEPLPVHQQISSLAAPANGQANGVKASEHFDNLPHVNGNQVAVPPAASQTAGSEIPAKAKTILSTLSGVEVEEIQEDSDLVEMGIDSLMAMELVREVSAAFDITLETDQLMDLTDFKSFVTCIRKTLGIDGNAAINGAVNGTGPHPAAVNGASNGIVMPQQDSVTNGAAPSLNGLNGVNGGVNGHHITNGGTTQEKSLPATTVMSVFRQTKGATDEFIAKHNMSNYYTQVRPRSTMLCAAYIVEAFEKLGCSISGTRPGERLPSIPHLAKHDKFMRELYKIIGPDETNLVQVIGGDLVRTATPCPAKSAATLLEEAVRDEPDHAPEVRLAALTGRQLADCLSGKADGLQIIFGSAEGRKTVSDVYAVAPLNYTWIDQATFFIEQLLRRIPDDGQPIKILEMGAGTGGTTATVVPMLAALGVPVTYTFTDLSSSLVAAARKRFKQYPFMEFKVVNIEAAPDAKLLHSQHIVLANACVHATRSLPISLSNIHQILRSDGLLMLLEETEQLPWVDFVFGLLEGWWLFEDGRTHAQVSAEHWEKDLRGAGFGHVDYTDGEAREAQVQRIIFGFASDIRFVDPVAEHPYPITLSRADLTTITERQAIIEGFVREYSSGFEGPRVGGLIPGREQCLLVTGATGSLGSHVVSAAARMPEMRRIVCLNRVGTVDVETRQQEAFNTRGIHLEPELAAKLSILQTDTSKPWLGLPPAVYDDLVHSVTHIVHSAWPMSLTRTTKAYEPQFQVMRNLIDLSVRCTSLRPSSFQFSFQLISSIGAVGYYPLWTGHSLAPETLTTADTALPVGYADSKIVCENMLSETLRRYPARFRAMAVRIAQITGSRTNGYWNPIEHFSFFVKSAQLLQSLPHLPGTLSWSPVNDVADSLLDLLMSDNDPYPIYHIENPVRQPWSSMTKLLAEELAIPGDHIVPYEEWLLKVQNCDASTKENPAKQLMSFWEQHFLRMSTGPLILDTKHSREHSSTMRASGPVEDELVRRYIRGWKDSGFLQA